MRGNGKIIQELEGDFRGSGWSVIKLIWGGYWDPLLAHDKEGILRKIMEETVDGEYQAYKANDGKFVREHFFGKHPKLLEAVSRMSDEDIWRLNRGGHDPHKVFAAFDAATKHEGQPTVILAKTIKGYGMGHVGQAKKPTSRRSWSWTRSANSATASPSRSRTTSWPICRTSSRRKIRPK